MPPAAPVSSPEPPRERTSVIGATQPVALRVAVGVRRQEVDGTPVRSSGPGARDGISGSARKADPARKPFRRANPEIQKSRPLRLVREREGARQRAGGHMRSWSPPLWGAKKDADRVKKGSLLTRVYPDVAHPKSRNVIDIQTVVRKSARNFR